MNRELEQIKAMLRTGAAVYWCNEGYTVTLDNSSPTGLGVCFAATGYYTALQPSELVQCFTPTPTPVADFVSELSHAEQQRIPAGRFAMIDRDTVLQCLQLPAGTYPRMYAYMERGIYSGQIVSIPSLYYFEQYDADIGFAWHSLTTTTDLIKRA